MTIDVLSRASLSGMLVIMGVMAFTIWLALFLGKKWKMDKDASALVGTGNAICGVSACLSVAPVVKAKPHNTYAVVGVISLLGLIGLFLIPWIALVCGLTDSQAAVFIGGSLHEIGNVVPAADIYHYALGGGDIVALVLAYKMVRVALLVIVAYAFARMFSKDSGADGGDDVTIKPQGFLIVFVAVATLMSLLIIIDLFVGEIKSVLVNLSASLLTVAMAGVGLAMGLRETIQVGRRLLPVTGIVWLFQIALLLLLTIILV